MTENTFKKIKKSVLILFIAVLIGGVLFFVQAFFGNPLSKYSTKRNGIAYVEKYHGKEGFQYRQVNYNFKTGNYVVDFQIPDSEDRHFSVYTDYKGTPIYDDYENIEEGFNTAIRLEEEYRNLTESVTNSFES